MPGSVVEQTDSNLCDVQFTELKLLLDFPFNSLTLCCMALLIFLGIAVATALLALNTIKQIKESLQPVPVRANNGR